MAVTTALGFLLASVALALQSPPSPPSHSASFLLKRLPAFLVLLLGLGTLGYYAIAVGAHSPAASAISPTTNQTVVNRTSPNTAVNFILLGAALCLLDSPEQKRRRHKGGVQGAHGAYEPPRWPYQILALTVVLDAFLALLGQIYGVTLLYGLSRAFGMALPTALLFLVLGFGVLAARLDRGFVAILLSNNVAGQAARRLLPIVVAVPLVLGGITLLGFRIAVSFATYLLVVASIALLFSLFWSTILTLNQEVEQVVSYAKQVADQQTAIERSEMIVQQRHFVRDMLASVTEGKLRLCDSDSDLSEPLSPASDTLELRAETLRVLRRRVMQVATDLRLTSERSHDLITAVGEASMNAVRHGGGGTARVYADPDKGVVQVWIADSGKGIREEDLQRATLEKGWSGAGSLGHGFYLMLRTVDRTYLLTGATGTTVVLEQERTPPQPTWLASAD